MAFIPTADVVKVALQFQQYGQNMVNTLFLKSLNGDPTLLDLQALATLLTGWVTSTVLDAMADDVTYQRLTITDQSNADAPSLESVVAQGTPGTLTGPSLPGNVTLAIKFGTVGRGRSSRGRNYVIGTPQDAISGNQVLQTHADGWVEVYNVLASLLDTDGDWQHVIVSYQLDGAPRANGFAQPVTVYTYTDLNIDSQRRRLTGRGT